MMIFIGESINKVYLKYNNTIAILLEKTYERQNKQT